MLLLESGGSEWVGGGRWGKVWELLEVRQVGVVGELRALWDWVGGGDAPCGEGVGGRGVRALSCQVRPAGFFEGRQICE